MPEVLPLLSVPFSSRTAQKVSLTTCVVIRILDAIDENASSAKVLNGYQNGRYYSLSGGGNLSFKGAEVADAHVFMDIHSGSRVYCDRVLRDALIEHGFGTVINPSGVWIEDAAGY